MRSSCFVDDSKLQKNCDLRLVPDQTILTAVVPSVRRQYRLRLSNMEGSADAVSTEPWTGALWNETNPATFSRRYYFSHCFRAPKQDSQNASGLAKRFHRVIGVYGDFIAIYLCRYLIKIIFLGVPPGPENSYPISDPNIRFSIPY